MMERPRTTRRLLSRPPNRRARPPARMAAAVRGADTDLIMTDVRIGRLLAASLHQAISDLLPQRLEFYENWLTSEGLRDGSIGLAPMTAVVGFLRTEEAYDPVVRRAGALAAEWTVASLPAVRRRTIGWLPRWLRARAALRVAADIVRDVQRAGGARTRLRRNRASFEVRESIFCTVRSTQHEPLCGFYVAVAVGTLERFGIRAAGRIDHCRGLGADTCLTVIELADEVTAKPAMAA